jgi:4'-phosphopantetheinyl transferase
MIETTGDISVYWLDLDLKEKDVEGLSAQLSDSERERVASYSTVVQQRRATVGFARRRQVLAEFCGIEPGEITFGSTSTGKPFVASSAGFDVGFNMSYCGGVGLIAIVRKRQVGVDVESIAEVPNAQRLTSTIATTLESRELSSLSPHDHAVASLRLWTRKEAYLKATGEGIGAGLKHFSVPLEPIPVSRILQPFDDGPSWRLYELPCPRQDLNSAMVISMDENDSHDLRINTTEI